MQIIKLTKVVLHRHVLSGVHVALSLVIWDVL